MILTNFAKFLLYAQKTISQIDRFKIFNQNRSCFRAVNGLRVTLYIQLDPHNHNYVANIFF